MNRFLKLKSLLPKNELQIDIVHPVFGELQADAIDDDSLWQGAVIFSPLNIKVAVNINAGLKGPDKNHTEFYEQFVRSYSNEVDAVSPLLIAEFEHWFGKSPDSSFSDCFVFSGLEIPRNGDRNNSWSITFDCLEDPNRHLFTVYVKGDEIGPVTVDG